MAQFKKERVLDWIARNRSVATSGSMILVGLITVVFFRYTRSAEQERLFVQFRGQTKNVYNGLHENFNMYQETVQSIRSFFDSGSARSLTEFNRFVARDLEQHNGIQALEWVPNLAAEDRYSFERLLRQQGLPGYRLKRWTPDADHLWHADPEHWADHYFPVAYMQPNAGNEAALGIDLASHPTRRTALMAARDLGQPVATAPIRLAQKQGGCAGFLLFVPIYKSKPATVEERRESLIGFALGVFCVDDIVEAVLRDRHLEHIHLRITDVSTGHIENPVLFDMQGSGNDLDEFLTTDYEHQIGGRRWRISFTATSGYGDAPVVNLHHLVLLGGTCLAFLVGGVVSLFLDRTHEVNKLVELRTSELTSAKLQLEKAHRDVVRKAELASEATRAKSEFLANMSHEIRTPMTAILGFTELLLDACSEEAEHDVESLLTIRRNGKYLLQLINDILDISKIEAGKLHVEQILCSVPNMLNEVFQLMQVRAEAKGLKLSARNEGKIPATILTDPTRFRQILINLVGNAIKFTEVGKVEIVVQLQLDEPDSPQLQVDVVDSGIGMTPEQVSGLFQAFVQADSTTTRKYGGTGLGLTISKRLCELMNGSIDVVSKLNQGSTFSFRIATGRLDGDVHMLDDVLPVAGARVRNDDSRRKGNVLNCRILLAEDGPDNQRLIEFVLQKMGAEVTLVENGKQAVDVAMQQLTQGAPFDVILMDMQMPVMDGYEATKRLRDLDYQRPIIALTAHAMSNDRKRCLDAGCDEYATKPINRDQLRTVIEQSVQSHFCAV